MRHRHRLIIVTGYGRQTGKTTIACRLIELMKPAGVTAVKISPHFHEPQEHLEPLPFTDPQYRIWKETSRYAGKDSSRYLEAGAMESYYIQAERESTADAFLQLTTIIPPENTIICESPSLAGSVIPDLLIVAPGREDETTVAKTITIPEGVRTIYIKPWRDGTEPETDLPPEFLTR